MSKRVKKAWAVAREFALSLPDTREDFPWGETVVKVRKKVFVFLGHGAHERFGFSVKLPHSAEDLLVLEFAKPTGYGLGKSGWVSFSFPASQLPTRAIVEQWIRESYVAVAPKTLSRSL